MRRLPLALPLSSAILWLGACDHARSVYVPVEPTTPPVAIRIGTFGPLTGSDARAGLAESRGFALAIETCNASGGVNGRPIVVVAYDDQSRTSAASAAANRLAQIDRVDLIVGDTNMERARAAAASAGPVAFACATCGDDAQDAAGPVGLAPGVHERAELVAEQSARTLGAQSIAILSRARVDADRAVADALRASLHARGVEAGDTVAIAPETIEARLAALADAPPQALCIAFDGGDAVRLGLAIRRRGIASALFCIGTPDLDILPPADRPAALEGLSFPSLFDASAANDARAEFNARFRARFASEPTEPALSGYAAGRRVIEAFARGPSASDLAAELRKTQQPFPLLFMRVERGRIVRATSPRN